MGWGVRRAGGSCAQELAFRRVAARRATRRRHHRFDTVCQSCAATNPTANCATCWRACRLSRPVNSKNRCLIAGSQCRPTPLASTRFHRQGGVPGRLQPGSRRDRCHGGGESRSASARVSRRVRSSISSSFFCRWESPAARIPGDWCPSAHPDRPEDLETELA